MEGPIKRKVLSRPASRAASPTRTGDATSRVGRSITVKAKVSSSSIVRSSTPLARSPPLASQTPRSLSPLRPNQAPNTPRPISMFVSHSSVFPPDPSHSSPGFVPKAKRSALALNKNTASSSSSLPTVSVTGPVSKIPPLSGATSSSNSAPAPIISTRLYPDRSSARSLTPTARPDPSRRRSGSFSDDGRSSNLSSHLSSNASLVSASAISASSPRTPNNKENGFGSIRRTSVTLGTASGHQPPPPSSWNTHVPIRPRAKLSNISLPTGPEGGSATTTSNRHARSNSASSLNSPRKPTLTPSPLHRRTPSATYRLDKQPSNLSSWSTAHLPPEQSSPTSLSRPRAATSISSTSIPTTTNIVSPSQRLLVPRSPVTSTLSSLSSDSGVAAAPLPPVTITSYPPKPSSHVSDVSSSVSTNASVEKPHLVPGTIIPDRKVLGAAWSSGQGMQQSQSRGVSSSNSEADGEGVQLPEEETDSGLLLPLDLMERAEAKIEAKSNRKIADLEITNRSLMAINTQLEAEKVRQMREIRELKRRLRESRLILPPGAFKVLDEQRKRAIAAGTSKTGGTAVDDLEEEDDDEDSDDGVEQPPDPAYERVTALVDALIVRGHEALRSTTESLSRGVGGIGSTGTKVLSPDEVQMHYARQEVEDAMLSSERTPREEQDGSAFDRLKDVVHDLDGLEAGMDDDPFVSGVDDE
ncbi:uncharacterized protein EI90DRAFT_3090712 [Cantharellus anzutake]|uniref:uncharacterized protein n=1 Tax=Cantharellus anzutake TaxID=1750568 RepID=UPI0019049157|nr:uncharacterized protein EI90DRAFT_3090712 [Cantharellus anzutake]KAF8314341.1 hypothetical protein EI90DRAFT_3090712 [Cantharellus anzutake]